MESSLWMMKKVSIIVPVFRSELFLGKLIDSIIHQSYTDIELILVDDGSPDKSGDICDEYAQKDDRIIVIHQENKGCCEARNSGLKAVTGYYVMFADGDDWLELDCVEYLVKLADENDCQMSMTDRVAGRKSVQTSIDKIRIMSAEEATCFILYAKTPIGPWNKLYSAKLIRDNKISFSVPWFGEGLYFSVMNTQLSNKVAVGKRAVYHYRLNNEQSGTSIRKVENGINALWNIRNIKKNLIINSPQTLNAVEWHIHRNCFNLLWFILGSGEKKKYTRLYRETRRELLKLTPQVFRQSEIGVPQKCLILLTGLCPKFASKLATCRRNWKFRKA